MKIKYVRLVLENCDSFQLEPKHFKRLIIDNIYSELFVNCYQYIDGEYHKYKHCDYFSIQLNENSFELESHMNDKLIKRLMTPDIVSIDLIYEDDSNENIYVPFKGEFNNEYQKIEIKNNKLIININKQL